MAELLTHAGYLQTREKLARMEARLAALQGRDDVHPSHRTAVERSYHDMMRQYRRDLKLYEAYQQAEAPKLTGSVSGQEDRDHPAPTPTE